MSKTFKKTLVYIAFGVGLYVLLTNIGSVWGFFDTLYSLITPVVVGFVLAFVLNVPMKGFRFLFGLAFKNSKRRPPDKLIDLICLVLVFIMLGLLCWVMVMLAIPSLVETVGNIVDIVQDQLPKVQALFEKYNIDPNILQDIVNFLHLDEDYNVDFDFGALISPLYTTATAILSGTVNLIFAIVVCMYALLSKAELHYQVRRMGYALFPQRIARYLGHIYALVRDTYAKFLTAQCIEAVILGIMMFLAFLAFGIPYPGLVAVLTALFAFLPYIGAFGACFVGALLTLVAAPEKVILCIIVYTVVQFTENQFIYPHVVGNSVGLSPVWTLIAALVGGSLLGLFGMIFFIPLASALYKLLGEFTEWRLSKKKIVIEEGYESFPEDGVGKQVSFDFGTVAKNKMDTEDYGDDNLSDVGSALRNVEK